MRVVIAGGGTAGHVFPALALAGRLVRDRNAEVIFVGTSAGVEAQLVTDAGFAFEAVDARPLARRLSTRTLTAPIAAIRSVSQCRPLVGDVDVVVGMGGYVSVPVVLAGIRARRPVVLHEQNAVPGLANRLLSRPAREVALAFPEAARLLPRRARTIVTGNPVRETIAAVPGSRESLAKEALLELKLEEGRRTVVVFGGSQGALHVNRATVDAIRLLHGRADLQFVLLTGAAHIDEIRRGMPEGAQLLVQALPFLDRMELAYAVADMVVARAGATTIAEVTACGLPSLLIPYPYATGRHQEANARSLQRAGAARLLLDDGLNGRVLAERVQGMVDDREGMQRMSERARDWATPDAAGALADVVIDAARST